MNNSLKIVPIKDKNELKKIKITLFFVDGNHIELIAKSEINQEDIKNRIESYLQSEIVRFNNCAVFIDKVTHIEWEEFDEFDEFDESDAPKQRNIDSLGKYFRYTIGFCFSIYILISAISGIIYLMQLIGDKT